MVSAEGVAPSTLITVVLSLIETVEVARRGPHGGAGAGGREKGGGGVGGGGDGGGGVGDGDGGGVGGAGPSTIMEGVKKAKLQGPLIRNFFTPSLKKDYKAAR